MARVISTSLSARIWVTLAFILVFCLPAVAEETSGEDTPEAAPLAVVTGERSFPGEFTTLEEVAADAEAVGESIVSITLRDAIVTALRNNSEVRVAGYSPIVEVMKVEKERSAFDPDFSMNYAHSSVRTPTFSTVLAGGATLATVKTKVNESTLSLASRLHTGGRLGIDWRNARSTTGNIFVSGVSPFYETAMQLTFEQPLLRGAGRAFNDSNITIARNNTRITTLAFEDKVMDILLEVDTAYWELVFAIEDLRAKAKSLQAGQDLLKNTEIMVRSGSVPAIEIARARSGVAEREEAIVLARAAVREADDRLRAVLDSSDYDLMSESWIFPVDRPAVYAVEFDLARSVENAFAHRPDIRQQMAVVENYGILVATTKNQLLPQVDIRGTYLLNGLGTDWRGDYEVIGSMDNRDVSGEVVFSIPFGNRGARSDYAGARYQKLQALANLERAYRDATRGVKRAIRSVSTSLQSIETSAVRREALQEQLEAEQEKYAAGTSIALDVLDAQDALQQAESAYIRSLAAFNVAMANYYRQTGTIFQEFGITVSAPSAIKSDAAGEQIFP